MQTLSEYEQGSFQVTTVAREQSWELELRPDGGLLTSNMALDLDVGDSISLTLRLSTGVRVEFSARVHRLVAVTGTAQAGAWIKLSDLSVVERREFSRWQRQICRERGASKIMVEVERTFRFRPAELGASNWRRSQPQPSASVSARS